MWNWKNQSVSKSIAGLSKSKLLEKTSDKKVSLVDWPTLQLRKNGLGLNYTYKFTFSFGNIAKWAYRHDYLVTWKILLLCSSVLTSLFFNYLNNKSTFRFR